MWDEDNRYFPKSFHDFLTIARPLHVDELNGFTIQDSLKLLVVNLKDRELRFDMRYHELLNRIDKYVTDEDLLIKLLNDDE